MARSKEIKKDVVDTVFLFTSQFLSKGLSALKDIIVAYFFGASTLVDIYFLALTLPGYLSNLVNGPIPSLALPTLSKANGDSSQVLVMLLKYFFSASFLISFFSTALALVMILFLKFEDENLFFMLGAVILLVGTTPLSTLSQVGYSWFTFRRDFQMLSLIPLISPFVGLTSFFLLASLIGEWALLLSFFLSFLVEALLYLFKLPIRGISLSGVRGTITQSYNGDYLRLSTAAVFLGSTAIVDNFMATLVGVGGVSVFNYGIRIVGALASIVLVVVTSRLHQTFNLLLLRKNFVRFGEVYFKSIIFVLGCTGLLVTFLCIFSPYLVALLYDRGQLSIEELEQINLVQIYYSWHLPFVVSGALVSRSLSSLGKNDIVLYISIFSTLLNVILNYFFLNLFGIGGVAISTTCVYFFSFVAMNFVLVLNIREGKRA
jgi:putative peptidoglycan lipid II flippase